MITSFILAAAVASVPVPRTDAVSDGLSGALRGCEAWILDPQTWVDGVEHFKAKMGLGSAAGLVDSIAEANQPPPAMRIANHYWRINSTPTSGYVLVVSDRLPMCHITGGGDVDLEPAVERVISSSEFAGRWVALDESVRAGMKTTRFSNREEPKLELLISRDAFPGGRTDRVQVIATAVYKVGK